MKKNTKLILAVVAVLVVIALFAGIFIATRPETAEGSKTVTVEVVHSDGSSKTFTYHTDAEYLGEVVLTEGLVIGEMGPYGLYIHEVDGEQAIYEEDGAYWAFYEGDEYATLGIDLTPVIDGGEFSLVYTIG